MTWNSHKWFDELNRLVEWFLYYADSDGIIQVYSDVKSTMHLWHLNAWIPLQLYLVEYFGKNSLWAKMTKNGQKWRKIRVVLSFWKILSVLLLETSLNKNSYCFLPYFTNAISVKMIVRKLWLEGLSTS